MVDESNTPDLADVLPAGEQTHPDHREHAKTPQHLDDDELATRTEQERQAVHFDDSAE